MKKEWATSIEKWILRLVIIQFLVLIIAQILMGHRAFTPYLNKAVRDEGVVQPIKNIVTESVDQPINIWYHK